MPKIRIPLSVVRSVPKHYTWFMVEGTPPIQARLANSSTRLEGGAVVKGLKFTQTGNYTILAKNDAGNSSKTVDVNVMGRVLSQVNMLIYMWNHISAPPCDTCVIFCSYSASFLIERVSCVAFELNALMVYFFKAEKTFSTL